MPNYLKDNYTVNEVNNLLLDEEWPESPFGIDPTGENTVFLLGTVGPNGQQNNTFLDTGPNAITITRNGDVTQGRFSPFSPTGWSAYFDGSGDYLTVASNAAFIFGSGDFTVECWVYASSLPADVMLITKWNAGLTAGTNQWILYLASGVPSFVWSTDGTNASIAATGSTITVNTWNHIAAVRSGNSITVYVNGVGGTAQSVTGSLYTLETEVLGISYRRNNGSTNNPLTGYISNLRILKGTAVYTGNFTPPRLGPLSNYGSSSQYSATANVNTTFPVANTSFLSLRKPFFIDDSINRINVSVFGDTKITPFSPFKNGINVIPKSYSGYFDGTGDYLSATLPTLSSTWTIEVWWYPSTVSSQQTIVSFNSGSYQGINIWCNSSGRLVVDDGFNAQTAFTNASFVVNQWNHLAVVRNGSTTTGYINGIAAGSNSFTPATANTISVGRYNSNPFFYASGYISNLRFVSNTAIYTGNFVVPTSPLLPYGTADIYTSTANVNTTFSSANTSLLTLQDNILQDNSSNVFTITATGDVKLSIFNPFGETINSDTSYDAILGGSAYFDGTGDYLNVSGGSSFILDGVNFTIEAWVYIEPGQNAQALCNFAPHNTLAISLNRTGASDTYIYIGNGSTWTGSPAIASSSNFRLNSWNHVALVRNGSTITLYHNGVAAGTTSTMPSGMTGGLYIGSMWTGVASEFLKGYISNFRILKGTALYTGPFVPPAAPLTAVANTSILTNLTNAGIVDLTAKNNIITVGNAQKSTSVYKFPGTERGSVYFDGTGDYMYVSGTSSEMAFGTGDFTVEFWVYPAAANQTATIIGWRPTNTNGAYINLYLLSGSIYLYVSSANRISGGSVSASAWSHIALARSNGVTKLFINGTQTGSNYTDSNSYLVGANRPLIGANDFDFLSPFNGYIDDLRITKGLARYTATFTPPVAPFTP